MKIGILTHQYINNFGAFLQAYALQEALKELFPQDEVRIINYVNLKHSLINTGGWFRFYRGRESAAGYLQKIRLPHTFAGARREYMALTKRCFSAKEVNDMRFDCIVVGSDEVWNYRDPKSRDAIKFGAGLEGARLVAYAPSVGSSAPNEGVPEYVAEGIMRFSALSARDDATAELIETVSGRSAERVLDPTFLAPCPSAETGCAERPYILFYYCDKLPEDIREKIFAYAKERGLAVYGAGECDRRYSDVTVNLTPFQWTRMFRDAQYVFTGTFHGAVFSILNRRPFRVYLTNPSRVRKVRALLGELGIEDRELKAGDDPFGAETPDYDAVERVLEAKRRQSLDYLAAAVKPETVKEAAVYGNKPV